MFNLAKVSNNGQITIPAEIRRELGILSGDKIFFSRNQLGEIIIGNAKKITAGQALDTAQQQLKPLAKELNLSNADEVQNLVNEFRYGK
ncbi:MAG: AbrB/MazE/SpoVT family DNA-binding domain-containing protein [Neisseriaceae bacterium]|nr:AbrB/MazE/SpoVT family DNA-binding domain-containing protein [Neisseriaceae bacterium]